MAEYLGDIACVQNKNGALKARPRIIVLTEPAQILFCYRLEFVDLKEDPGRYTDSFVQPVEREFICQRVLNRPAFACVFCSRQHNDIHLADSNF